MNPTFSFNLLCTCARALMICLIVGISSLVGAQNFPVQATTVVIKAGTDAGSLSRPGAMIVSLVLIDDRPEYTGGLRLRITDQNGQEWSLPPEGNLPEIRLVRGAPLILSGEQLRPYLEGILGADAGAMTGEGGNVFAEGILTVCAEFYDPQRIDTGPVSNESCGQTFIQTHAPPTNLMPIGPVAANPFSQVLFSWAPGHVGGPVNYELTVWEMNENFAGDPLNSLGLNGPIRPAVTIVGGLTTYSWGLADAIFEIGQDYAWMVRAVDPTGIMCFRGDGYSRPEVFTYGIAPDIDPFDCIDPQALSLTPTGNDFYSLSWTAADPTGSGYNLSVYTHPGRSPVTSTSLTVSDELPSRIPFGNAFRFTENLPVDLPTAGGQAYAVEICVTCPETGEVFCEETILNEGAVPNEGDPCQDMVPPVLTVPPSLITATTLPLQWSPGVDPGLKWTVTWAPEGNPADMLEHSVQGDIRAYTITGLEADSEYEVSLCLVCEDGTTVCTNATYTTMDYRCVEEAEMAGIITAASAPPDGLVIDYHNALPGTDPNAWGARLTTSNGERVGDLQSSELPDNETGLFRFSGLVSGETYSAKVCYTCPDGGERCIGLEVEIAGCEALELAPVAENVSFDAFSLRWTPTSTNQFRLGYAEEGTGEPDDFLNLAENTTTISGLQPLTTYEVRICTDCDGQEVCETVSVTTTNVSCRNAGEHNFDYVCGTEAQIEAFQDQTRILNLAPGDTVWAGDFLVRTISTELQGQAYLGRGITYVPLLDMPLEVIYQHIEVNENCRLIGGQMVVKSPLGEVWNVLNNFQETLGNLSNILNAASSWTAALANILGVNEEVSDVMNNIVAALEDTPYMDQGLIDDIRLAAACLVASSIASEVAREADASPVIQEAADAAVELCRQELVDALNAAQQALDDLFNADFQVQFEREGADNGQFYGLDSLRYEGITEGYDIRRINGRPYKVKWASTSTDLATAVPFSAAKEDGSAMTDVEFIKGDTRAYPGWTVSPEDPNRATHPGLTGLQHKGVTRVYATQKTTPEPGQEAPDTNKIAGQLNVVTYHPEPVVLHIVPFNGAIAGQFAAGSELDTIAIRHRINEIFRPAVASVQVIFDAHLNVTDDISDGNLEEVENAAVRNYTDEMIALRRTLRDQPGHDRDHYYLVVVPTMGGGRDGFMPRKLHYGFLNNATLSTNREAFARTAAHELAHGAFRLEHLDVRFPEVGDITTDNLMDNDGGTALYKYQWDNVHDPEFTFSLFDDEEEGESVNNFSPDARDMFAKALADLVCAYSSEQQNAPVLIDVRLPTTIVDHSGNPSNVIWEQAGVSAWSSRYAEETIQLFADEPDREISNGVHTLSWSGPGGEIWWIKCSSDDGLDIFDWFDGDHGELFRDEAESVQREGTRNGKYKMLSRMSSCTMGDLEAESRFEYLDWLLEGGDASSDEQKLIARLLGEVSTLDIQYDIGLILRDYQRYESLFNVVDNPVHFKSILSSLAKAHLALNGVDPTNSTSLLTNEIEVLSVLNMLDNTEDSPSGLVSSNVSTIWEGGEVTFVRVISTSSSYGGPGFPSNYTSSSRQLGTFKPMDPIGLFVGQGHEDLGLPEGAPLGVVPAALAAGLAQRRTTDLQSLEIRTAINIELILLSGLELGLALEAYANSRTVINVARVTVATSDFLTSTVSTICAGNMDEDLCQEWQRIEGYIQLGLLSFSIVDGLQALSRRTSRAVDNYADFLEQVDGLLPGVSSRNAFRADWDLNIRDFRTYFGGATDVELVRRVRAWEVVKHLPDDIRLSVPSLQNISDILSSTLGRNDKLALIRSKITSSSYEHGVILAPDGTILELRVGSPNSIDFSDLHGNLPSGNYFIHNHPASGTFSDPDIITASGFQFSDFSAVTRSGKKYTMRRTPNSVEVSPIALNDVRVANRNQLRVEYESQFNQTAPGSPERSALMIEINEELDRRTLTHFGFEYIIE